VSRRVPSRSKMAPEKVGGGEKDIFGESYARAARSPGPSAAKLIL
jgi:hypothetical protein